VQVSDLEKSTHKMDTIRQAIDPSAAANQEITHDIAALLLYVRPVNPSRKRRANSCPSPGKKARALW
jgi:hypothetical protein